MYTLYSTKDGVAIEPGTPFLTLGSALLAAHVETKRQGRSAPQWTAHCYGDDGSAYSDSHWQGVVMPARGNEDGPWADWIIRVPH